MQTSRRVLVGRTALVTGASRGIGLAVAQRFAREGADLIVVGRSLASLGDCERTIRAEGGRVVSAAANLLEAEAAETLVQTVRRQCARLDILVGNAGVLGPTCAIVDIAAEEWEEVINVNLTANWQLLRGLDPLLRMSDAGRAIFVTSSVTPGRVDRGAYAASKAGLEAVVRTYAAEVAATPVRANMIDPGARRTCMRAEAFPQEDPMRLRPADDPALLDAFVELASPLCQRTGETLRP